MNSFDFLDDDPQSVDCVVQYFYRLDYHDPCLAISQTAKIGDIRGEATNLPTDITGPKSPDLVLHVKVYALAEKYDIPPLKALSLEKFQEAVQQEWNSDHFLDAAREAYTSTIQEDEGMRNAVVKVLHTHREPLLDTDTVQEFLQELPSLAYDLLMYLFQQTKPVRRSTFF